MHRVESNRIVALGGLPGFEYRVFVWDGIYDPQWPIIDARLFPESYIANRINTVSQNWYVRLYIDYIHTKSLLDTAREHFRNIGDFNMNRNCYEIDLSTSALSLGVNMQDLIYGACSTTQPGITRVLIAALNDGIISRVILPQQWASDLITRFLSQSHTNPRALARGLYEGWIPFLDCLHGLEPRLQRFSIELPLWTWAQSE